MHRTAPAARRDYLLPVPSGPRLARAAVEAALAFSGIAALAARGRRGRTLVLAYHNVVPDDWTAVGDRSLHIAQSRFAAHLETIIARCDVVPLAALADRDSDAPGVGHDGAHDDRERRRPRVILTFDDAYHGTLTLGVEALARRALPATIFVPPGLLGNGSFWWDAASGPDGLDAERRAQALDRGRGVDADVRRLLAPLPDGLGEATRPGTAAELAAALTASPSLTLGAHTWSHANLTRLAPAELADEMTRPLEWLSTHVDPSRVVPWLTYPYGFESPAVRDAARVARYNGAFRVDGGWLAAGSRDDRFALPRLNVPAGMSSRGLGLRLAGLMGSVAARAQQ
jgi:peptidoglycan/xylan/chitin deacetylase (PgdA/CDA1 family)